LCDSPIVEREQAVRELPHIYQQVLAWLDEGVSPDDIAARLDLDVSATAPLIDLARAKLARLTGPDVQP